MKNNILLLLAFSLASLGYGQQTIPQNSKLKITRNIEDNTATRIVVQSTTDELNYIHKDSLKSQIGLGNVDNTSDLNKPISSATQSALNLKLNSSALTLQSVLNQGNTYTVDSGNSALNMSTGTINNRIFDITSGDGTNNGKFGVTKFGSYLQSDYSMSSGWFSTVNTYNGKFNIFQDYNAGVYSTTIDMVDPVAVTTLRFPAKQAGVYTLATTFDVAIPVSSSVSGIVNNTSLQELGGVDKLINGVRIGKGNTSLATNTALGLNTLNTISSGSHNTAIGNVSLRYTDTGAYNTSVGSKSLELNTSGGFNTSLGAYSLAKNTTAGNNTGVGYGSFYNNITGTSNTGLGSSTGYNAVSSFNTFIGSGAGSGVVGTPISGGNNTFVGASAGARISTGANNVIVGSTTDNTQLGTITTGSNNVILGTAITGITTGSGNVIVGKVAGLASNLNNNVVLANGVGNIAAQHDGTNWTFSGQINKSNLDTAPTSSTDVGTTGQIRITSDYIYVCVATNTWVRTALTW
ncbi:hypothetical protein GCM10008015_26960 [Flavobacterium palustre]|uniref:Uncharacterized protein n=1 Tax=Flavobacterium palustre TaxID=1476463 RepID=A0ABQ1HR26_9FLAO|nr:hypothetical protein [Flavobacterium palustre]GGA84791.1 hypothetical protein GCM10008015_26960 [Flavobacterium palustre]